METTTMQYICNHVVLPPELPQADDSTVAHEKGLARAMLDSITSFRLVVKDEVAHQVLTAVTSILKGAIKVTSSTGAIDRETLVLVLKNLTDNGHALLYIKAQNAGLLLTNMNGYLVTEAFELSPVNSAVFETRGRLKRHFPDVCNIVEPSVFKNDDFQTVLTETIVGLSNQQFPGTLPQAKKGRQTQDETRETRHPHMVTEFLMSVLQAVGKSHALKGIIKHTREEVLWKDCNNPWRRSPFWMLLRVGVQLLCTRLHSNSAIGNRLYKAFMIHVQSQLLDKSLSLLKDDMIYAMATKLSRRLLKWEATADEDTENEPALLIKSVQAIMQKADTYLQERWSQTICSSTPALKMAGLQKLDFAADSFLSLPKLDAYLARIADMRNTPQAYSWTPSAPIIRYQPEQLPALLSTGDHKDHIFTLAAFEHWVESNLQAWLKANMRDYAACPRVWKLMLSYHRFASQCIGSDPELHSVMILTMLELWVAMDSLACFSYPLLQEYQPELPAASLQSLVLPFRSQMLRLSRIEKYTQDRRQGASPRSVSVFTSFGNSASFAVRYFDNSITHQDLHRKIEEDASQGRKEKAQELELKKKEHKRLMDEHHAAVCEYEEVVIDDYNDIHEQRHVSSCKKCRLKGNADRITINIHEWPLPKGLEGKATVFEIDMPIPYAAWREATLFVLIDILGSQHASARKPRETYTPSRYDNLRRYVSRSSGDYPRIQSLSEAKPFIVSHYKAQHIEAATTESVCKDNGLQYEYFDNDNTSFIGTLQPTNKLFEKCGYVLTKNTSVLQRFLTRPPTQPDGLPHNEVLASQAECPMDMPLREFRSWGTVPCGDRLLWLNLLKELAAPILDLSKSSTSILILQVINQTGRPLDGTVERMSHALLADAEFGSQLLRQLQYGLQSVEANWESCNALASFVYVATRLLTLAKSAEIQSGCLAFLHRARYVALKWTTSLMQKVYRAVDDGQRTQFTLVATKTALICASIFDLDQDRLEQLVRNETDLSILFQCSVTIQENQPVLRNGQNPLHPLMLHRWEKLLFRTWPSMQQEVLKNGNFGLDLAVRASLLDFNRAQNWSTHPSSDQWLLTKTAASLSGTSSDVQFNVLTGQLLMNGCPLARLPLDYQEDSTYDILFGSSSIQVRPSNMCGMRFTGKQEYAGYVVHFGMLTNELWDDMVVHGCKDGRKVDFIPSVALAEELPISFSQDYVHWYDRERKVVEFRSRRDPWSDGADWKLSMVNGQWLLTKVGFTIVNPASETGKALADILGVLDLPARIHILLKHSFPELQIELPRLRLCFTLMSGSSELVSRDFRHMVVDSNQGIGSLIGLHNKLVLRHVRGNADRKVIIPEGSVTHRQSNDHVKVYIGDGERSVAHIYQIDDMLGRLVDKGTLDSKLFLCYLHGLTAHFLIDPLTKKTGTEAALSILSCAALRSFDRLSEKNIAVLHNIARLSPRRSFYPQHMRSMQTVQWDSKLSFMSQHGYFSKMTDEIFAQWKAQQMFHPDLSCQIQSTGTNTTLVQRDLLRFSSVRTSGFGAEEFTSQDDNDYASYHRPSPVSQSICAHRIAVYLLVGDQTLPSSIPAGMASRIWTKFEGGNVEGPDLQFKPSDTRISVSWLEQPWPSLRSIWCKAHKAFQDPMKRPSKYSVMMWLAFVAFGLQAPMEAIYVLAALYNGGNAMPQLTTLSSSFTPKTGYESQFSDIYHTVSSAQRAQRSCESMWSQNASESVSQFKHRRKREFDAKKAEAIRLFTSHIHEQWPCRCPEAPSIKIVADFIDVEVAMPRVKALFSEWYENRLLRQYLDKIETGLSDWFVKIPTAPSHLSIEIISPVKSPKAFISEQDLFRATTPELLDTVDDGLARLRLTAIGPSPSTTRLSELLGTLKGNAHALYAKDYVRQLHQSIEALQSHTGASLPICDDVQLKQELLSFHKDCTRHFSDIYHKITNALAHGLTLAGTIAWDLKLRPRISPIFLLSQLLCERWSDLSSSWKGCLVQYGNALVSLQRAERLLALHENHTDLMDELLNVPHTTWKPEDAPENLVLEIESGIAIRSVQEDIAHEMRTTSPCNKVMQLNMGEGKSSVIVPMVVLKLADRSRLVRIVVPKPQARQLFQMLTAKLGSLLGKRIYHLPVSRALKLSEQQAMQIEQMCLECMSSGGVLLVQPEHILSLKLMALDFLAAGKTGAGKSILRTLHLFHLKSRDIVDESDEIFSVRFELVYTMGIQNPIDFAPDRWRVILTVLQLLPQCALEVEKDTQFSNHIEMDARLSGRFPKLRFLNSDASSAIMDLVADKICSSGFHGLPVAGMCTHVRRCVKDYIRNTSPRLETMRFMKEGGLTSLYDNSVKKILFLLRGLIADRVLAFAFSAKRWRVNFGPDPSRRPETRLAVPYRAKDCPTSRSEYSHPDVVITLTAISYYYAGLSDEELFACFQHMLKSDQAPAEYAEWVQSAPSIPQAFRELIGVNIKDEHQCIEELFPQLRRATGVVNYYLQDIVFPKEMREFPHKLSASGWDIAEVSTFGTTGFSGTNDSRYLLPLAVEQLDLPGQKHTNALVLNYLLQPETQVKMLPPKQATMSDAEHLLQSVVVGEHNIRVVLDVGAQILELDNLQVAELWLRITTHDAEIQAAIFVDAKDEVSVLDRDGHVEPLESSPFLGLLENCVVFLDEAHTRGIDLRLPRHYRAAVTLGPSLTKDRLVQACMRLRKLGKGQSVTFCVSEEIRTRIADLKGGYSGPIEVEDIDILHWTVAETFVDLKRSIPLWAVQGHRYTDHAALWADALRDGSYEFSPEAVQKLLEPEAQTLEQRYEVADAHEATLLDGLTVEGGHGTIHQRCREYEAEHITTAALLEEQERELSPEIEEERQTERPPRLQALAHQLHPKVVHLVTTGRLVPDQSAFLPAFETLQTSSAAETANLKDIPGQLLVTTDFARTVCATGIADSFFRMPQWVVTVPKSFTGVIEHMVIISPFEAQELLPQIEKHKKITLHLYAPRMHQAHKPLDKLDLFNRGRSMDVATIPYGLILQLNMFSGQTYLSSYAEYEEACKFLGVKSKVTDEEEGASDGDVAATDGTQEEKKNLVEFVKVLFTKVRRDCEGIDKTHLGKILYGTILTEQAFEEEVVDGMK